jgi:hypothetical protein
MKKHGLKFSLVLEFTLLLPPAISLADCTMTEKSPWTKSGAETISLLAYAVGETCAGATVGFSVVNSKHEAVWTYSKIGNQIAYFLDDSAQLKTIFKGSEADQRDQMKKALHDWIDADATTADSLPDWPKNIKDKLEPKEGDFGFYSDENLLRESYLDYRKRKVPLFCFHSGIESRTCIVADKNDAIVEIGGESIP